LENLITTLRNNSYERQGSGLERRSPVVHHSEVGGVANGKEFVY